MGAAHGTLIASVWTFLSLAPIQLTGAVIGAFALSGGLSNLGQTEEPPPEFFGVVGGGCFVCVWLPILFFWTPWILGGLYGQLHDRLTGATVESYSAHGSRFYGRMLLLLLAVLGMVVLVAIPMGVVNNMIQSRHFAPGDIPTPEVMRAAARDPLAIAMGALYGLILSAVSVVATFAYAHLAANDSRATEAIGGAFGFAGRNAGDAFKLYCVYLLTGLPMFLLQMAGSFLSGGGLAVLLVVALIQTLYLSYLVALNGGIGASVALGRGIQTTPDKPAPAESLE